MHLVDHRFPWSPLNRNLVSGREQPRDKVLIYGSGAYRDEATCLLADSSWEVWACNLIPPLLDGAIRADRWFDLHQRVAQSTDDLRWIAACKVPIYVPDDLLDAGPTCVPYPLDAIEDRFDVSYWACTFAYQIALALWFGVKEIGLYGVEMQFGTDRERSVEWANVAYWVGRAEQSGVLVRRPGKSFVGRHVARYGLEYQREIDKVNDYLDGTRTRQLIDELNLADRLAKEDA